MKRPRTPFSPNQAPATGRATSVTSLVDDSLRPVVDSGKVVGMSVGVVSQHDTWRYGLGTVSRDRRAVPCGNTIYEIGSISKVFTGILLADMAERGEVSLDDPVGKFLPSDVSVPQRNGKAITLRLLATHASGLPRLPTNLKPRDAADPYKDYSEKDLYDFLSKHELKRDPGTTCEYSNLGMGLLGWALARRAGKPTWEELVIERVTSPLGMNETRVGLTDAMRARMAQGYTQLKLKAKNWTLDTLAGAGGLRSSIDDMCRFVRFCLAPDDSTLGRAVRLSMTPERELQAGGPRIGLAWLIQEDGALFHNGGTGGYHSFVSLDLRRSVGVVVLTNSADDATDAAAARLLDGLVARAESAASR